MCNKSVWLLIQIWYSKSQSLLKVNGKRTENIPKCNFYNWNKRLDISNVVTQEEILFGSISQKLIVIVFTAKLYCYEISS